MKGAKRGKLTKPHEKAAHKAKTKTKAQAKTTTDDSKTTKTKAEVKHSVQISQTNDATREKEKGKGVDKRVDALISQKSLRSASRLKGVDSHALVQKVVRDLGDKYHRQLAEASARYKEFMEASLDDTLRLIRTSISVVHEQLGVSRRETNH